MVSQDVPLPTSSVSRILLVVDVQRIFAWVQKTYRDTYHWNVFEVLKDRQQSIRPVLVMAHYIDNWYFPTKGPCIRIECLKVYFRGYLMV